MKPFLFFRTLLDYPPGLFAETEINGSRLFRRLPVFFYGWVELGSFRFRFVRLRFVSIGHADRSF